MCHELSQLVRNSLFDEPLMAGHGLIERARRAAGLTQSGLALRAHTPRPTLSAYENGRRSTSLETVE